MGKSKRKSKNNKVEAGLALQSALDFRPEDIQANRDGYLSQAQRAKLTFRQIKWMGIALLSTLAFLWPIVKAAGRIDPAGSILWLMAAGIAGYGWYKWKQYFDDLRTQEIDAVQGRVELDIQSGKNSSLKLGIQDMRFTVRKDVFLAFKNGDPYTLYYAVHSKTILSAEWLRET